MDRGSWQNSPRSAQITICRRGEFMGLVIREPLVDWLEALRSDPIHLRDEDGNLLDLNVLEVSEPIPVYEVPTREAGTSGVAGAILTGWRSLAVHGTERVA